MLTIGELAKLAGTTVRAVRHYHATGLLAEPERDASGYRRYGANALVRLVRIRLLRELGVPLERVRSILDAGVPFDAALDALDAELAAKAAEIAAHRARIAAVRARRADPELPVPLGEAFTELATRLAELNGGPAPEAPDHAPAPGHDQPAEREKEALLLLLALSPESLDDLVAAYRRLLDDADLTRRIAELDRRFAALADEPEDSPAVEELVEALFADPTFAAELAATDPDEMAPPRTLAMFDEYFTRYRPAQRRFASLAMTRAQAELRDRAASRH